MAARISNAAPGGSNTGVMVVVVMVPMMVMVGHLGSLSLDGFGPWRVDGVW